MTERKSFILYTDYEEHLSLLSTQGKGELFEAIFYYIRTGNVPQLSAEVGIAFSFIRSQLDRDNEKYDKSIEQRKEAAKKSVQARKKRAEEAQGMTVNSVERKGTVVNSVERSSTDTVNDTVTDTDNVNNNIISCPEAQTASEPPQVQLPLKYNSEYPVYRTQIDEWNTIYPDVDILQELRNMRGWLIANPARRKTKSGMLRFVNGWLKNEQNKKSSTGQSSTLEERWIKAAQDAGFGSDVEAFRQHVERLRHS